MLSDGTSPHTVDLYVGARVRLRRKFLGMTQQRLAETIGLTFQQVQKYERGTNRISASKLFEIAQVLKTPIAYFFDGYGQTHDSEDMVLSHTEEAVNRFLLTGDGIELASLFPRIRIAEHRRKILNLVVSLAEDRID